MKAVFFVFTIAMMLSVAAYGGKKAMARPAEEQLQDATKEAAEKFVCHSISYVEDGDGGHIQFPDMTCDARDDLQDYLSDLTLIFKTSLEDDRTDIRIFRDKKLTQKLSIRTPSVDSDQIAPKELVDFFDITLDGYDDLEISGHSGHLGDVYSYPVYLVYNPSNGLFEDSLFKFPDTDRLYGGFRRRPLIDAATKTFTSNYGEEKITYVMEAKKLRLKTFESYSSFFLPEILNKRFASNEHYSIGSSVYHYNTEEELVRLNIGTCLSPCPDFDDPSWDDPKRVFKILQKNPLGYSLKTKGKDSFSIIFDAPVKRDTN